MQNIIFFHPEDRGLNDQFREMVDNLTLPGLRIYCMSLGVVQSDANDARQICANMRLAILPIECAKQVELLSELNEWANSPVILLRCDDFDQFQHNLGHELPGNVYGCVGLSVPTPVLLCAIHMVLSGGRCFPISRRGFNVHQDQKSETPKPVSDRASYRQRLIDQFMLTERQVDILYTMRQGMTVKEAAQKLNIAPGTIKTHAERIYVRLQVNNRAQAVYKVFVEPDSLDALSDEGGGGLPTAPRRPVVREAP